MLLKRSLALAIGLLLFIGGFFAYFQISDSQAEARFHQERVKFGMEGTIPLTSSFTAPASSPSTSVPVPADTTPAPPAPANVSITPTPADNPVPASSASPDTNVIIGPMPPSSSSTPDTAPAPAPSNPPDTNSAPMTPPPSTMLRSRLNPLSFLVFAAYTPSQGMRIQAPASETTPLSAAATPAPPVTGPSTNEPTSNKPFDPVTFQSEMEITTNGAPSSSPATNETSSTPPSTNSDAPRPVPIEASVIVLGYHQFCGPGQSSKNVYTMSQDVFEQEMKYLKDNGYHVVPLSDVVRFVKHEIGLPPNSVAITIDDGYKSAITYAAPILKQYGYPWTFFVYPDYITTTESIHAASWPDLLALQADGVDIESHTMRHPYLTRHHQKIKDVWYTFSPEEYDKFLILETAGSKALLEQKLGKPISYLAYPYGDYNKVVEAQAIAAGYDAIFTVADNPVHSTTNKYSIGRYVITKPVEKLFATYLRQGALSIANADPAPGTTTSQPRPVITAVLGYAGNLDPKSIETDVRDYGAVRHDFDPKTSTVRLYLPRDLIQQVNIVNIRVKDADSGQVMVANWHFNYEPANAAQTSAHPPIADPSSPSTNTITSSTNSAPSTNAAPSTNTTSSASPAPTNAPTAAPTHISSSEPTPTPSSKNPISSTSKR